MYGFQLVRSAKVAPKLAALLLFGATASAQTYTKLYQWPGTTRGDNGIIATEKLSQGRDGLLYGTIFDDGTLAAGEAYKITTTGTFTTLWAFCQQKNCPDGAQPEGGVILGLDGNFYGTTAVGGVNNRGVGTVFQLTPSGTHTKLYDFTSGTSPAAIGDGGYPAFGLLQGADGNFYGVNPDVYAGDYGLAYKLTPKPTPPWTFKLLGDFNATNGWGPNLPTQGADGNFYGTTNIGGNSTTCKSGLHGCGVVYKMSAAGKLAVLHTFVGVPLDGYDPVGILAEGTDDNFYGTTYSGGATGQGSIFKITPTGVFTELHDFNHTGTNLDGYNPYAGLILGSDGNFYGTAVRGGGYGAGAIYRITPSGTYTIVYNFCKISHCPDGFYPITSLVQHTNGKFYGSTSGNTLGGSYFYSLDMGLGPFIIPMTRSGKAGVTVEILGTGLTGASSVNFGAGSAAFTVVSDTYMTAVVPSAGTLGQISVTTPTGTFVSNYTFKVLPVVQSFTPTIGPPGTVVTITGTSLLGATKVTIGGVACTFTVNSDTQITATVAASAKTGKIAVTTLGGVATSAASFTVN